MAKKLSEYSVLEIISSGNYGEACYKVKHKCINSLLIWKAYDCKDFTKEQLHNISNEVKLISKVNIDCIINYMDTILHTMSNTLYIVIELYPNQKLTELIAKSKSDNIIFEESFIWSLIYQLASASKIISEINVNILQKQLKSSSIFISPDSKVKIDPFYLKLLPNEAVTQCSNKICEIGDIIYEMCTWKKYSENKITSDFHYSEDLQNIVNILLHDNGRKYCVMKPDMLLHHPTVLSNLNSESVKIFSDANRIPTPVCNNDSAFESDVSLPKISLNLRKSVSSENVSVHLSPKSTNILHSTNVLESKSIDYSESYNLLDCQLSPTLVALDLKIPGYVPSKVSDNVRKWRSRLELCKEPQEVSEQAMSHVWLKRMEALKEREEAVKMKELEIDRNKIFKEVAYKICSNLKKTEPAKVEPEKSANKVSAKSMTGITLQTAMNQKVFDESAEEPPLPKIKNRVSLSDGSVVSNSNQSHSKKGHRRTSSVRTRCRKKKQMSYEDMNSSLSADQGDTSILPTSTKMSASIVPRPVSFHNMARRKVHFNSRNNPFAEYDSVSSTTLTFFEIENFDDYEVPKLLPPPQESIADRIAKFTYLDLEAMTNQKRALMEELRKTPPKVNREIKPTLRSKVKAADNLKKFNHPETLNKTASKSNFIFTKPNQSKVSKAPSTSSRMSYCSSQSGSSYKSMSSITSLTKMDDRRKTIAPVVVDIDIAGNGNFFEENKENVTITPIPKLKKDSKRRSILGFKTPFKFKL